MIARLFSSQWKNEAL